MKIRIKTDNSQYDKWLSNFIIGYLFFAVLNQTVKLLFGGFFAWSYLSKGCLAILLLFALIPIAKYNVKQLLLSESIGVSCLLLSLLFGDVDTTFFYSNFFYILLVYIPLGLSAYSIVNYEYLLKWLYRFSWPSILLLIIVLFVNNTVNGEYLMSTGYYLLIEMLVLADHFSINNRLIDLIAIVISFVATIMCGSRGPIFCFAVFVLLKILLIQNISQKKKVQRIAFASSLFIMVALFFNKLLNGLIALANVFGFKSRTLMLLLNNSLVSHDSGRNKIYLHYLELINDKYFFWGAGITGGWIDSATYPHNIFIEFMLTFGMIIGLFVSILFVLLLIKGLRNKSSVEQRFIHILFAYCISLLVSGSFAQTALFYVLIAMCFKQNKKGNVNVIYEKEDIL